MKDTMLSEKLAQALAKSRTREGLEAALDAPAAWRTQPDSPPESEADDTNAHFESTLDVMLRHARFVTGADGAALALGGAEGVVCRATCGYAPERGVRLDPDTGICGRCLSSGEVIIWNAHEGPAVFGVSSVLAIPIRVAATTEGVIAAFSRSPKAFSGEHLVALTRIANVIAHQIALRRVNQPFSVLEMSNTASVAADPAISPATPLSGPIASVPQRAGERHTSDPVVTEVSGVDNASTNALVRIADPENELRIKPQSAATGRGECVVAESKEAPEGPEEVVEDVSAVNVPVAFRAVMQVRQNYVVPVITTVLLLLIAWGMVAALSWRARQMEATPVAAPISQPAPAAIEPAQDSASPSPENAQPRAMPATEGAPDERYPGQSALPSRQ